MKTKHKKVQVVIAALDPEIGIYKILLLMTNEKRGSFWQNVTGSVEENETFEEAALREAIEETGLNIEHIVDLVDLGHTLEFTDQRKRKVTEKSFLLLCDQIWKIKIDPHEHQESHWCELGKLHPESVKWSGNWDAIKTSINLIKRQVA